MDSKMAQEGCDRDSSRDRNPKMTPFPFRQLEMGQFRISTTMHNCMQGVLFSSPIIVD